jgi:hypothetical protein
VARTIYSGTVATNGQFCVGSGRIRAVLTNHAEAAAECLGFIDTADHVTDPGTTILEILHNAGLPPVYIRFPQGDEVLFANGLYVTGADNSTLSLWVTVNG